MKLEARMITPEEIKNLQKIIDPNEFPCTFDYLLGHGFGSAIPTRNVKLGDRTQEDV